jgi:hypothetical protein
MAGIADSTSDQECRLTTNFFTHIESIRFFRRICLAQGQSLGHKNVLNKKLNQKDLHHNQLGFYGMYLKLGWR